MDCFSAFFCFLAYGLSGFLRLFADSLGSLFVFSPTVSASQSLCFFSDCLSGFLGFFTRSFKSILDCLACFFCSVLYVLQCSFLSERNKRSGHGHK